MTEYSYDWWHRALAGEKIGGPNLPVHEDAPQPGFYRRRFTTEKRAMGEGKAPVGPFKPVAIFVHDGELIALIEGKRSDDPKKHWLSCCRHPVTEEAYKHAVETGTWPDTDERITPPSAPIGHNAPADDAEAMKDQVDTAASGVDDYAKIEDEETAAKAQSLRSRLLELSRDADNQRKAEKEPHLEAGKAVDARWQPIVKAAKAAADKIAGALSAYLTAKARAEAEERRKAEAAQRKADEEAAKAAAEGKPAPELTPAPAPIPDSVPTQIKGGYGRAATVKAVKVVTEVTDQDALYSFLKTHPELKDLMKRLAQRAVDAGKEVPGVTIEEQRKVA